MKSIIGTVLVGLVFLLVSCNNAKIGPDNTNKNVESNIGEYCCCEFLTGDIMNEDWLAKDECLKRGNGKCITVNPGRLTPHPCCPNAQGERCGS